MKKFIVTLLLTFSIIFGVAQDEARVTFSGVTIQNPAFTTYSVNPSIDFCVGENFNIHYSLGFGVRSNKKFYMHMSGLAPVAYWILKNNEDIGFLNFLGFALFFVPEGISYDISLNDKWEVSPFVNINSAESYAYGDYNEFRFKLSVDGGIATRYYFSDKLFGQIYTSAKLISTKGWGISSGFGIGLSL